MFILAQRNLPVASTRDSAEEDLLQETMLKALNYRKNFRENTNFKAWVFTIMKNHFINDYRRNKLRNTFLKNDYDASLSLTKKSETFLPEATLNYKELNNEVEKLEDEYKKPFTMYVEGFKYQEIAEEMGLPIGTIKSRIFIARKKLSEKITR